MKGRAGRGPPLRRASPDALLACIRAARAGDRRAGRALVDFLLPVVRARVARVLLRRYGRVDPERLDDGEQDAWARIWVSLDGWSPAGGRSLANWVGWSAERVTWGLIQRGEAQRRDPGQPAEAIDAIESTLAGGADPEGEAALRRKTDPARLCPCLHDRCTERELVIARMLHLDGWGAAEVARSLATSAGQIYKANHRFKAALRHCVEG